MHENNPAHLELVVVGKNGGLENVVLYISQGLQPGAASQKPSTTPGIRPERLHVHAACDRHGCRAGIQGDHQRPDRTQHSSRAGSHDRQHPMEPVAAAGCAADRSELEGEEIAIPVKCNIHPWMHGYHVVVKGPYAVTDDSGSFTLENIPPGSYTVTAWQETYGTQTQKVTVAAGQVGNRELYLQSEIAARGWVRE